MSSGNLFHRVKVCWKKECWCDEVFACGIEMVLGLIDLLLYGMVLGVIGASGNLMNLNKWHSFICVHLALNEGIFAIFKRSL